MRGSTNWAVFFDEGMTFVKEGRILVFRVRWGFETVRFFDTLDDIGCHSGVPAEQSRE